MQNNDNKYPEWIPVPPEGFEDLGQAVDPNAPQFVRTDTCPIEAPEEQAISIDVMSWFSGSDLVYGLEPGEHPPYLSMSGSIISATAVEVQETDEKEYTVGVFAYNRYGRALGTFQLIVIAIPEWDRGPNIEKVAEGAAINLAKTHNTTRIDTYTITTTPSQIKQSHPAYPTLTLTITTATGAKRASATITGTAPDNIHNNMRYRVDVTATNVAGSGDLLFFLVIEEDEAAWNSPGYRNYEVEEGEPFSISLAGLVRDIMDVDNFTLTPPPRRGDIGGSTQESIQGAIGRDTINLTRKIEYYDAQGILRTGEEGQSVQAVLSNATSPRSAAIHLVVGGNNTGLAPYVMQDTVFTFTARARNEANPQPSMRFNVTVTATAPEWSATYNPPMSRDVDEQQPIGIVISMPGQISNFVKAYSNNEPIVYRKKNDSSDLGLTQILAPSLRRGPNMEIDGQAPGVNPPSRTFNFLVGVKNRSITGYVDRPYSIVVVDTPEPDTIGVGSARARWIDGNFTFTVVEGDPFNVDVSVLVLGTPAGYELIEIRRTTTTTDPEITPLRLSATDGLRITSDGVIIGSGSLRNAPNVKFDEYYNVTIELIATQQARAAERRKTVELLIKQKLPDWNNIPNDSENEQSDWSYDISGYCDEEPDTFTLHSITTTDADAPTMTASIHPTTGVITGTTPDIDENTIYTFNVNARNNAGTDLASFDLLVQQTIPEWTDIPVQEVDEALENVTLDLAPFVENDPESYAVISVDPSDLVISVVGSAIQFDTPVVNADTDYTVTLSATNSAGTANPNGTMTIRVVNLLPEWTGNTTFELDESTTDNFNLLGYVSLEHDAVEDLTLSFGSPTLQQASTHESPLPTITVSDVNNTATNRGQFSITASSVGKDAYFNLPAMVTNAAGSRSRTFIVHVVDVLTTPVFEQCSNQEFNEDFRFSFNVRARSTAAITYSKVSGAAFANISPRTGLVTGTTPPVNGTIAANPSDNYSVTFRATAGTETADCTLNIRVFNTAGPVPPQTPAEWISGIADRAEPERKAFSFNIARHASGNPTPIIGERTNAGTPEWVRISSGGQVSGTGPSVGTATTVATLDGKVWRMKLSVGRSVTVSQVTISSGALPSGVSLINMVENPDDNTVHYLVFSGAVATLQTGSVRVTGSPAASVNGLAMEWYTTYTVYATASNIIGTTQHADHTTFEMLFVNTDDEVCTPPTLDVDNLSVSELDMNGDRVQFSLDLTDHTTGTAPFTYERTLIGGGPSRYTLPGWLSLTEAGMLSGQVPLVEATEVQTVRVTARNDCGTSHESFTITVQHVEPPEEHNPPVWNISNKSVLEETMLTIDPLGDDELTGDTPITITETTGRRLPSWLSLSNNIISGEAPAFSSTPANNVFSIALTATNTDSDGVDYPRNVTFTVTVLENVQNVAPVWDIDDKDVDEGDDITIDPLTNGELTGTRPITIDVQTGTTLPSWLTLEDNVLTGEAPAVTADRDDTVQLTATNSVGSANVSFTVTINDVPPPVTPHTPPTWRMANVTYPGNTGITIDPITGSDHYSLTGSTPMSITVVPTADEAVTQPTPADGTTQTTNLPRWLTRTAAVPGTSNDIFTGTTPNNLVSDTVYTVRLRARNTDSAGVHYDRDVTFTITVEARPVDPNCVPAGFSCRDVPWDDHIDFMKDDCVIWERPVIEIGETQDPTTFSEGVIDFSHRVKGTAVRVYSDPYYVVPTWVQNPDNMGAGRISWRISNRKSVIERILDGKDSVIEHIWLQVTNECVPVPIPKARLDVLIRRARRFPPVIGPNSWSDLAECELDPIPLPEGGSHNSNLGTELSSTHVTDSPKWRKEVFDNPELNPWQDADWWTLDEQGNLSINPPDNLVTRDTTRNLYVEAYNSDGTDRDCIPLTVRYIPDGPVCQFDDGMRIERFDPDGDSGFESTERIRIDIASHVNNTVTDYRIDSVTKVTVGAPDIALKVDNTNPRNFGVIFGSDNASGSGAVGTTDLAAAGQPANVFTDRGAPVVTAVTDYEVTFTAINTGLVTTPEFPSNSAQCSFILRIKPTTEPCTPPSWVNIPLQTSVSGESISISVAQYARPTGEITGYTVVSTVFSSGFNAGTIVLQANAVGVITRQGGAVAPNILVGNEARYVVTVRATNACMDTVDTQFVWRIVPPQVVTPGAPAILADEWEGFVGVGNPPAGYDLFSYDPVTGRQSSLISAADGAGSVRALSSDRGPIFIEGIGTTLWALFGTTRDLGRITFTGDLTGVFGENYARLTVDGAISGITGSVVGLTSIGTTLYTFGYDGTSWKLYSIDTSTRVATVVNSASSANNLGFSSVGPSGLSSIGSTIYAIVLSGGNYQWVSIPTQGTNRGIATVINANLGAGIHSRYEEGFRGLETFGSNIQTMLRTSSGNNRLPRSIVPATGAIAEVRSDASLILSSQSFTQLQTALPTISRIPLQVVTEGERISFPLADYVTGATFYSIGTLRAVTTGAPLFPLEIDRTTGIVRGTSGNLNAPPVVADSSYSLLFRAHNTAGYNFQDITIVVANSRPTWDSIPPQFVTEGQRIFIALGPYARNQPTSFSVRSPVNTVETGKPDADAPNLNLQIDASANLYGIGATVNAPDVSERTTYTILVTAENTAGSTSTTVSLTIEDAAPISEQVPYVLRWDVPEESQGGSFDVLIDFNIPIYGLLPNAFRIEGVVLRGTPELLWSPTPFSDTEANRPNAEARSLDYLTNPVPVRGTRYYKLSFSRDILPETITRDQLMNIYMTSNTARGGVTS